MSDNKLSGRLTTWAAAAALLGTGYLVGATSRPNNAMAENSALRMGAGDATFGFAVPGNGFAVVSDAAGSAWVISSSGTASRVLYSISGAAPDRPNRTEEQLPLR